MGKIQPEKVGARQHQPFDRFTRVAGRSEGGDDLGMTEHGESLSGFGCADAPGNERTLTL
jgi:hypothetical protein